MRIRDWYFQGWEKDAGGALVYTGEYYSFPDGIARARKRCALLSAPLLALYAVVALFPTAGGMWRFAAIPQLLELIPLIYLVMGLVRLMLAREPLTYRDWHASWQRLDRSALGSTVFTASMALAELVYIPFFSGGLILPEIPYLLGEAACLALSILLMRYIKQHPCSQSITAEKE